MPQPEGLRPQARPDTLAQILRQLEELGIEVQIDGDDLVMQPMSKVPAELKALIREHKPVLIALFDKATPIVQEPFPLVPACTKVPERWFDGVGARTSWRSGFSEYDPANKRCATCAFHDRDGYIDLYRKMTDPDSGSGFCRRNPPIAEKFPNNDGKDDDLRNGNEYTVLRYWPETFATDWCGEWVQAKIPAYTCVICRHPLLDHTLPIPTGTHPDQWMPCNHDWPHGPLRCWCYCEVRALESEQQGAAA